MEVSTVQDIRYYILLYMVEKNESISKVAQGIGIHPITLKRIMDNSMSSTMKMNSKTYVCIMQFLQKNGYIKDWQTEPFTIIPVRSGLSFEDSGDNKEPEKGGDTGKNDER